MAILAAALGTAKAGGGEALAVQLEAFCFATSAPGFLGRRFLLFVVFAFFDHQFGNGRGGRWDTGGVGRRRPRAPSRIRFG